MIYFYPAFFGIWLFDTLGGWCVEIACRLGLRGPSFWLLRLGTRFYMLATKIEDRAKTKIENTIDKSL